MGRKKFIRESHSAYHVTGRSNNQDWFYLPISSCWDIFSEVLIRVSGLYGAEIHAFVLMSNHFHLILSQPNGDIDMAMRYLMTEVSKAINRQSQRINHVFGSRYKWSVLRTPVEYAYVYKYLHRNPVRAGAAKAVEEYPFSSLSRLLAGKCDFPVMEGFLDLWRFVPKEIERRIAWLNIPTPKEVEELIKKALRRYEFKFPAGNDFKRDLKSLRESYQIEAS